MLRSSSEEERFLYGPEDSVDEEVAGGGSRADDFKSQGNIGDRDDEDKNDEDNDDDRDKNDEDKINVGASTSGSSNVVDAGSSRRRQRKFVDTRRFCYDCRSGMGRIKRLLRSNIAYEESDTELDVNDFVEDSRPEVHEVVFETKSDSWRSLEPKESFRRGKRLRKSRSKLDNVVYAV